MSRHTFSRDARDPDSQIAELATWLNAHSIKPGGPFFLRLHVVGMPGDTDIEVGALDTNHGGDGRVRAGIVPDGEYALIAYTGSELQANRTLLRWVQEQDCRFEVDTHRGALQKSPRPPLLGTP